MLQEFYLKSLIVRSSATNACPYSTDHNSASGSRRQGRPSITRRITVLGPKMFATCLLREMADVNDTPRHKNFDPRIFSSAEADSFIPLRSSSFPFPPAHR